MAKKISLSPEASAQLSAAERTQAQESRREGNKLYGKGRYREAIEKFRRSYELNHSQDLLYSIAVSYQQLESWEECVSQMELYLEKAPTGPKRDRAMNTRKNCEARIERDQELIIESKPKGAQVFVDDKRLGVVGTTPYRNFIHPGPHKVWVQMDGYEPFYQDIVVQRREPFRLNIQLKTAKAQGYIYVDCPIKEATVYIEGKNIGLTPFKEPLPYPQGHYQVVVKRDGYEKFNKQIELKKGRILRVEAKISPKLTPSTWRSPLGWTTMVLGGLSIGSGFVAGYFADQEYNDTDKFDELLGYQKLGFGLGGGMFAAGISLIVWDALRVEIPLEHRNPRYGQPISLPGQLSLSPGGFIYTFSF